MISFLAAAAIQSTPVDFRIVAPGAKKAEYVGDLTSWGTPVSMTKRGSVWSYKRDLPADARLEYQFILDGAWTLDPRNERKVDNGFGGFNSVWIGPAYRESAPLQPPKNPMRRFELQVRSENVPSRTVVVFLPPQDLPDTPILIYQDGKEYEQLAHIQTILQNLVEQGKARPAALVLVSSPNRNKEYWQRSAAFERFITSELLQQVRTAYPSLSKSARNVFVGGSSLGGLISLRLAERNPGVIAGGAHSQSGAFHVAQDLVQPPALRSIAESSRLYLDWGIYETPLTDGNERMARALRLEKRAFGSKVTNEGHNWTAWRERLPAALMYLLPKTAAR